MKNSKTLIILAVVFIALLVVAGILYTNLSDRYAPNSLATQNTTASTESEEKVVPMAPYFTVTDTEGNLVSLDDFLGKPIILNFWASWCAPCRSEMPDIQQAYETYGDRIHFLIVNLTDGSRETIEIATDYITQAGFTFPIYFDPTLIAANTYGAYSIPVTYFIGANGEAIARYAGAMPADILQQGIDMLLGE